MKVSDLFIIDRGSSIDLILMEPSSVDGVPYVSRSANNNGISAFVAKNDTVKLNPPNTISVPLGGSVLEAHYHDYEYYSGQNVAILTPKVELTRNQILYYCLCIRANAMKYCFGRHANKTLKHIELPDVANIPQWVNTIDFESSTIDDSKNITNLDLSLYTPVCIADLFDIKRGNALPLGTLLSKNGVVPVISSKNADNGVAGYTNVQPPNDKLPCLTLAVNGSIGACFYQELPFHATADVAVLLPKFPLTSNIGLYIAAFLRLEGATKYSYGRKIDNASLENMKVPLPFNSNGIDFAAIELYMATIQDKFKIGPQ